MRMSQRWFTELSLINSQLADALLKIEVAHINTVKPAASGLLLMPLGRSARWFHELSLSVKLEQVLENRLSQLGRLGRLAKICWAGYQLSRGAGRLV